jgi:type I restriction enzyme S subunit
MNVPSIKQTTGIQNLDSKSYLAECAGFPSKFEQQEIAEFLDGECQGFATTIEKLEKEIQLLIEFRIRLATDIVTGKLDVREAAAKLPEDVPPETNSDIDLGDDIDNLNQEASK